MKWFLVGAAMASIFAIAPVSAQEPVDSPVSEAELRADIAYLASDALEGRAPGSPGETQAVHYIATQLAQAGFVGAADASGGWYQPVPLVELYPQQASMTLARTDGQIAPGVGAYRLRAPSGSASLSDVPLIFVGNGVDDEGRVTADVRGKVALLFIADRAGENALALRQRRDAMIAAGAVATLLVPAPQQSFAALDRRFSGGTPQLANWVSAGQVEGMLSPAFADTLLGTAGNSADLRRAASDPSFPGTDLPLRATMTAQTARRAYNSYNVVARRAGGRVGSGTVLMTGHWDHLGICGRADAEDRICNGAVDNASGIAVLLAVARRLGSGAPLDRDVLIVATTAEESGLLGAYHLASAPPAPLPTIAVTLNVDTVAIAPRGAPVATIGRGVAAIDAVVADTARALGRRVDDDGEADAFVRRQDGWALQKSGVPAIMAGGSFSDMALLQQFLTGHYHGPDDELHDDTPLGGAADDADLHVALARRFGNIATFPVMREQ